MRVELAARDYWRLSRDPVRWAEGFLGVELWSRQREVLRGLVEHRRVAVPSGHAVGKTFTAAVSVLWFLFTHPDSKVITTAPTWRQVVQVLWSEVHRLYRLAPRRFELLVNQLCSGVVRNQSSLRLTEDWYAVGVSSDRADNLQGYHAPYILVVFDEAGGIMDREVWEAMDSLTAGGEGYALAIGNPLEAEGPFWEACSGGWHVERISCLDTPAFTGEEVSERVRRRLVTKVWVDRMREEWGEESVVYQSRVLGRFPEGSDDSVVRWSWLESARGRAAEGGSVVFGVDVARYGSDQSVVVGVFGNEVRELWSSGSSDLMHVVGAVRRLSIEHRPEVICVDEVGLGSGVVDRLRELGEPVMGLNFGSRALDSSRFENLRAECWHWLGQWIKEEGCLKRASSRLIRELLSVRYTFSSRGLLRVEPKDEVRKRLGYSPDYADALALAVHGVRVRRGRGSLAEYSDYAVVEMEPIRLEF